MAPSPSPASTLLHRLHALLLTLLSDARLQPYLAILKGFRNGLVFGTKIRLPHALVMTFLFRPHLPFHSKLTAVLKATRTHALNLATYVAIYKASEKLLHLLLSQLLAHAPALRGNKSGLLGSAWGLETFLAGCAGGYYVFGRAGRAAGSSVNQQLVLYVFARVAMALARLSLSSRHSPLVTSGLVGRVPGGAGPTYHPGVFGAGPVTAGTGVQGLEGGRRVPWVEGARAQALAYPVFASVSWGLVMWLFRFHPDDLQPSLRSSMRYLYENAERWDGLRSLVWHNS